MKRKNLILICAIGGIALVLLVAIILIGFAGKDTVSAGGSSISSITSSSVEEASDSSATSVPESTTTDETTTAAPETTTVAETTTTIPETTTVAETTTTAPETTTVTETTTNVPETSAPEAEWTEESCSGEMYVITSCYSRSKAVLGAETVKLYNVNELVTVTAKTDTGYYKIDTGAYIHSDYLSVEKATTTTTKKEEKPEEDDYGYTEDGHKILGYNGDGYAIIGYTPDSGRAYIAETDEMWITGYKSDGTPKGIDKNPTSYEGNYDKEFDWVY